MKFNKLVMLIHPDINPNIENPGDKMIQAVTFKDDEKKLESLAIKWGLIENTKKPFKNKFTIEEGKDLIVNDDRYIIVDVKKEKNYINISTIKNDKIYHFKRNDINDQDESFYVDKYTIDNEYMSADMTYQCLKK
jgi:hypothetical protein